MNSLSLRSGERVGVRGRSWFQLAGLLLMLAGCSKGNRPHPRIAELTTPIHLTLRTLNGKEPRVCSQPGTLERLWCQVTPAAPRGLTFLEVNEAADHPLNNTGSWDDDQEALRTRHGVITVAGTAQKKATLFLDDTGKRLVIDFGELGVLVRLEDDEVLRSSPLWHDLAGAPRNPDGSIDWARIPPNPVKEAPFNFEVNAEVLDAAIAARSDGVAALGRSMLACIQEDCPSLGAEAFDVAFSRLDEPQKTVVQAATYEAISAGQTQLIPWFRKHPELQGDVYVDSLIDSIGSTATSVEQTRELIRLSPRRLGERMCRLVEDSWHEADRDPEMVALQEMAPALAIIAHGKVKCPWVGPWLARMACRDDLSCSDAAPTVEPPLCPTAIKRSTLAQFSEDGPVGEVDVPEYRWAPLLLLAAEVQGPLPTEFVRREARKRYRLIIAPAKPDEACTQVSNPGRWACRLPLTITEARRDGCRIVIDDARQTISVSSAPSE